MISGLVGRGLLILAFVLSVVSPAVPVFGLLVAVLVGVAFVLCSYSQRGIWLDGWHAAHDHHDLGDSEEHLDEYKLYLSNCGF